MVCKYDFEYLTSIEASQVIKRFVPLFNRILVERTEPLKKTVGGIILPDNAAQKINWGTVIEVGSGKFNQQTGKVTPLSLKKGDAVMLGEFSGQKVKVNDKELLVVNEEDVLGVIEFDKK